ncbi:hypothetical protein RDWZM_000247 [Blomia tropicalis]|uniref:Uncharacterized protein n=1 Tax=Blomia tropicalis TaxID=40697 RepID=A0A9Q0MCG4_BLOTA|nr:hypothetical protein RDWZM_000247 [Blomia tropicalis]
MVDRTFTQQCESIRTLPFGIIWYTNTLRHGELRRRRGKLVSSGFLMESSTNGQGQTPQNEFIVKVCLANLNGKSMNKSETVNRDANDQKSTSKRD